MLSNIYEGEVIEVKDDRVKVKIPSLDIELSVFDAVSFGYEESKSGYIFQLPKVGDRVLITFEEGDYHKPILLLGQKFSIKNLKKDQEFIKTKLLKIVPEKLEGPEEVSIDYDKKQITIKSPVITLNIDLSKGIINGRGGAGSFNFNLVSGQLSINSTQVSIQAASISMVASSIVCGGPIPLMLGAVFSPIFDTHIHLLPNGLPTTPPMASSAPALSMVLKGA